MELLDLPDCMVEQILECISYDEIAKQRLVCRRFNFVCQRLLNTGFNKMQRRHASLHKAIKAQLPRRESERRNHPLSKHSDILTCIDTRMSMLSMTYTKYMEVNLCCFIPGKVIDEVLRVLDIISSTDISSSAAILRLTERPLRTHEILQELRDISSMSIDHFEEKIAPSLKKAFCELPSRSIFNPAAIQLQYSTDDRLSSSCVSLPAFFSHLQQGEASTSSPRKTTVKTLEPYQSKYVRMERKFKLALKKLNNVIGIQKRQAQKLRNCSMQINELNAQVIDLRRRLEETNNAKKSLEQIVNESNSANRRNIKPRAATIILKRVAESTPSQKAPSAKQPRH